MTNETVESLGDGKARGAFYTPAELTRFMARWAVRTASSRVLEPSAGDGAFVAAIVERLTLLRAPAIADQLVAVEREPREASKARSLTPFARVLTADFFDVEPSTIDKVDAVLGNPPYIRYHGFTGSDRAKAQARAEQMGVRLSRLASSWAHFVVHAVAFLAEEGRLALVLPAELLHADYAAPVRELLLRRFTAITIVAFDRAVFSDAQVDAVLLLASNDDLRGLRVVRVRDQHALAALDLAGFDGSVRVPPKRRWSRAVDEAAGDVYADLSKSEPVTELGVLASVDIGFVSGANDFFVLTEAQASERQLPSEVLVPAVRRPGDIPGLLVGRGEVHRLLSLSGRVPLDGHVEAYLATGAAAGISERYKCRVRRPWYAVPMPRRLPDAFLPYMAHAAPRLIVNDVGAWSTNLIHGVSLGLMAPPARALAVAMTSAITLLSAEVEGRAYGGGVLKLETREAERLLVPTVTPGQAARLEQQFDVFDALIRNGEIERAARAVADVLGLAHDRAWAAYFTFRERRLGRKRVNAA